MKQKESLNDELKNIAPFLQEVKKRDHGFKTPPGYFDHLEEAVFQKIEARDLQPQTGFPVLRAKRPLLRFMQPKLLMAAAATLTLVFSAWWFLHPKQALPSAPVAMELSAEDVEAYVLENVRDFDADQLAVLPDYDALPDEETAPAAQKKQHSSKRGLDDLKPEDVEGLLKDMTEDELEQLL